MSYPSLKIAGAEVSIISWLTFNQAIAPIGGSSVRRMANGSAFKMNHWRKWRISLSCSGWVPAALNAVDYSAPFEIELPFPLALKTAEPLPAGFTARSAPWTEHNVTDQAGVTVRYVYVKATVIGEPPSTSQSHDGQPSWELTLETV